MLFLFFFLPFKLRHEGDKIRPDADFATSGRNENCVGT